MSADASATQVPYFEWYAEGRGDAVGYLRAKLDAARRRHLDARERDPRSYASPH